MALVNGLSSDAHALSTLIFRCPLTNSDTFSSNARKEAFKSGAMRGRRVVLTVAVFWSCWGAAMHGQIPSTSFMVAAVTRRLNHINLSLVMKAACFATRNLPSVAGVSLTHTVPDNTHCTGVM